VVGPPVGPAVPPGPPRFRVRARLPLVVVRSAISGPLFRLGVATPVDLRLTAGVPGEAALNAHSPAPPPAVGGLAADEHCHCRPGGATSVPAAARPR
jgi:hypothetical protein